MSARKPGAIRPNFSPRPKNSAGAADAKRKAEDSGTSRNRTQLRTALDMASAVRNCVQLLDVPLTSALRFASTHPAQFLGLGHVLGRLLPGFRADMVALDAEGVTVAQTWVAGVAA